MKKKMQTMLLSILTVVLLCSCGAKTNTVYKDLVLGTYDVHLSNFGDSLQQVKDAEISAPDKVLDDATAERMFGPNTAFIQYTNRQFAGMDAKYSYVFKDDKLGECIIYLKTDTPDKVYKEMVQFYNESIGKCTESGGDGKSADSYTVYNKDGKVLDIFIGSNNQVCVDVYIDGQPILGGER